MRILIITHFYDGHHGGPQILAREMGKSFTEQGDEVVWIASRPIDGGSEALIKYRPVPALNPFEQRFGIPYPFWGWRAFRLVLHEVAKAEVVHIHEILFIGSLMGVLCALFMRKPVVLSQHIGPIPYPTWILRKLMILGLRCFGVPAMKRTSAVIFESDQVANYFRPYLRKNTKMETVRNGVNQKCFSPVSELERSYLRAQFDISPKAKIFLFIGRFIWKKGLHRIQSMAIQFPNCLFLLVGYGSIDPKSWKLPNLKVIGGCEHRGLSSFYRLADLLISPGVGEGIPLVVQEAMACGTPCLISKEIADSMPGLSDVCYWFDENKPRDDEQKLGEIIKHFGELETRRIECTQFAKTHWDWDKYINKHKEIFTRSLENLVSVGTR